MGWSRRSREMIRLKDWGLGWETWRLWRLTLAVNFGGGVGGDSRSNFVSWEKSFFFKQQEFEVQAKVRQMIMIFLITAFRLTSKTLLLFVFKNIIASSQSSSFWLSYRRGQDFFLAGVPQKADDRHRPLFVLWNFRPFIISNFVCLNLHEVNFFQIWSAPTSYEDLGEGYRSILDDDHKT